VLDNVEEPASKLWLDLSYMDANVLEGMLFAMNEFRRVYSWDMSSSGTTEPTIVV
jgi:hypothetical protein